MGEVEENFLNYHPTTFEDIVNLRELAEHIVM